MAEPTYELLITDYGEIDIKGTEDKPIFIKKPYWENVRIKYSNYNVVHYIGKKRLSHTFHSDDIVTALKVIRAGGDEKAVSKAIATGIIWAESLMKHCNKIIAKEKKVTRRIKKSKVKPKNQIELKKIKPTNEFNINLNTDVTTKLNKWV